MISTLIRFHDKSSATCLTLMSTNIKSISFWNSRMNCWNFRPVHWIYFILILRLLKHQMKKNYKIDASECQYRKCHKKNNNHRFTKDRQWGLQKSFQPNNHIDDSDSESVFTFQPHFTTHRAQREYCLMDGRHLICFLYIHISILFVLTVTFLFLLTKRIMS